MAMFLHGNVSDGAITLVRFKTPECIALPSIFSVPYINILSTDYQFILHHTQTANKKSAKTTMVRFKPTVRRSTQSSFEQVRTTKKVRFADDLTPEQDRPIKKAKSTQAPIHQTIDGRIRKTDSGKTASSKNKRISTSKVLHRIGKPLVDYSDSDDDMDVDANDEVISDEETRGSPSPSRGLENESDVESEGEPEVKFEDESDDEPEGSEERPQRGWAYNGLGRWTQT